MLKWIAVMVGILPTCLCIVFLSFSYTTRQPSVVRLSHPQSAFVLRRGLLVAIVGDYPEHILAFHALRWLGMGGMPRKSRDQITDADIVDAARIMVARPRFRDLWLVRVHTFPANYCRYYAISIPRMAAVTSAPFVALILPLGLRLRTRWHRNRHGLCRNCGYNQTGNVSGRCPECGEAITRPGKPHET